MPGPGVEQGGAAREVGQRGHQSVEVDRLVRRTSQAAGHPQQEVLRGLGDQPRVRVAQQVPVVDGAKSEVLEAAVGLASDDEVELAGGVLDERRHLRQRDVGRVGMQHVEAEIVDLAGLQSRPAPAILGAQLVPAFDVLRVDQHFDHPHLGRHEAEGDLRVGLARGIVEIVDVVGRVHRHLVPDQPGGGIAVMQPVDDEMVVVHRHPSEVEAEERRLVDEPAMRVAGVGLDVAQGVPVERRGVQLRQAAPFLQVAAQVEARRRFRLRPDAGERLVVLRRDRRQLRLVGAQAAQGRLGLAAARPPQRHGCLAQPGRRLQRLHQRRPLGLQELAQRLVAAGAQAVAQGFRRRIARPLGPRRLPVGRALRQLRALLQRLLDDLAIGGGKIGKERYPAVG